MDSIMLAASTALMALNFIERFLLICPAADALCRRRDFTGQKLSVTIVSQNSRKKIPKRKKITRISPKIEKYLLASITKVQQAQKEPGMFGEHSGLTNMRRQTLSVIAARCQLSRKGELFCICPAGCTSSPLGGAGKAARL